MRVSARTGGFSLIEVAVAAAVLALGCLASAGVLEVTLHAEAASRQRSQTQRLLDAEAARLEALPFYRVADGPGGGPPSLLGDVFPHARRELNGDAGVFGDDSGAAVFRSEVETEGGPLRRTARLVSDGDGPSRVVLEAEVAGYAVWNDACPPALSVDVTLELSSRERGIVVRTLHLQAFRPVPASSAFVAGPLARRIPGRVA